MITYRNVFQHELIGLHVEIVDSLNKSLIGNKGIVIDESKYTISLELENKTLENGSIENGFIHFNEKTFIKNISVFQFILPNGELVEIDGKILVSRPEDRLKKKFRKI